MINTDSFNISIKDSIDIGALYGKNIKIKSEMGPIEVGLMQGEAEVLSNKGNIQVRGISGQCAITAVDGDVKLHIDSLETNTTSSATASNGSLIVDADPKVVALVSCRTLSPPLGPPRCTPIPPATLNISSETFQTFSSSDTNEIMGLLSGPAISRSHRITTVKPSGKVDLSGDWLQAVAGDRPDLPRLALTAGATLTLHSLTWREAIRRRHLGPETATGDRGLPE